MTSPKQKERARSESRSPAGSEGSGQWSSAASQSSRSPATGFTRQNPGRVVDLEEEIPQISQADYGLLSEDGKLTDLGLRYQFLESAFVFLHNQYKKAVREFDVNVPLETNIARRKQLEKCLVGLSDQTKVWKARADKLSVTVEGLRQDLGQKYCNLSYLENSRLDYEAVDLRDKCVEQEEPDEPIEYVGLDYDDAVVEAHKARVELYGMPFLTLIGDQPTSQEQWMEVANYVTDKSTSLQDQIMWISNAYEEFKFFPDQTLAENKKFIASLDDDVDMLIEGNLRPWRECIEMLIAHDSEGPEHWCEMSDVVEEAVTHMYAMRKKSHALAREQEKEGMYKSELTFTHNEQPQSSNDEDMILDEPNSPKDTFIEKSNEMELTVDTVPYMLSKIDPTMKTMRRLLGDTEEEIGVKRRPKTVREPETENQTIEVAHPRSRKLRRRFVPPKIAPKSSSVAQPSSSSRKHVAFEDDYVSGDEDMASVMKKIAAMEENERKERQYGL